MAMATYDAANLDEWVKKCERRLHAVAKQAAQSVLEEASEAGPSVARPSAFGTGKMPIDTGFLRQSLKVSLSGMPSGEPQGVKGKEYPAPDFSLQLSGVPAGSSFFAGWTAVYARKMERRYGFMRSAAQGWQQRVNDAVAEAKARFA